MSTRYKNNSPYENRERVVELQEASAHTHRAAEHQHDKQDHLTGPEQSRQSLQEAQSDHRHTQAPAGSHGIAAFGHDEIAALAYELWQARGCPDGSPQEDWFNASEQLRSRSYTH